MRGGFEEDGKTARLPDQNHHAPHCLILDESTQVAKSSTLHVTRKVGVVTNGTWPSSWKARATWRCCSMSSLRSTVGRLQWLKDKALMTSQSSKEQATCKHQAKVIQLVQQHGQGMHVKRVTLGQVVQEPGQLVHWMAQLVVAGVVLELLQLIRPQHMKFVQVLVSDLPVQEVHLLQQFLLVEVKLLQQDGGFQLPRTPGYT